MGIKTEKANGSPGIQRLCIGLLAHVDAGKTTLSEALLYTGKSIRSLGRVDHQNSFLDHQELERARGITIFSKQARITSGDMELVLLDTPGHTDFSSEMERVLGVLDGALLVINGKDGIQSHTLTLWRLLEKREIPVILFVNKMDTSFYEPAALLEELRTGLSENIVNFSALEAGEETIPEFLTEEIAYTDESLLEILLAEGNLSKEVVGEKIRRRRLFPCYFGSALKLIGVEALLFGVKSFFRMEAAGEDVSGLVYKISRDFQGNRLTHLKLTGGRLRVRDRIGEEKINQIRLYNGSRFETAESVEGGTICTLVGLFDTFAGQILGKKEDGCIPLLRPVLSYDILFPGLADITPLLPKLMQLMEEDPMLSLSYDADAGILRARLMGRVQIEVLERLIRDRFEVEAEFVRGSIVYLETLRGKSLGLGHFEPLRHYGEVHLLLEEGERNSGLVFSSAPLYSSLFPGAEQGILRSLRDSSLRGVLGGYGLTDMKITLLAAGMSKDHTEGGDLREAARRALRQGLLQGEPVLLEPYYDFTLELPLAFLGRAIYDLNTMHAVFDEPRILGEEAVITGHSPVATMQNYQEESAAYSGGRARLYLQVRGYEACHNPDEVLGAHAYDPQNDPDNPADSVFCANGKGFLVKWNEVEQYIHIRETLEMARALRASRERERGKEEEETGDYPKNPGKSAYEAQKADSEELMAIFERTYGKIKPRIGGNDTRPKTAASEKPFRLKEIKKLTSYLLVDGYNILFSWESLRDLARENIDGARERLIQILSEYQANSEYRIIAVFDAYKVPGHDTEIFVQDGIHVVFTKTAETADQYIEKTVEDLRRKYRVTVSTSDGVEQIIIRSKDCLLLSAKELEKDIIGARRRMEELLESQKKGSRSFLLDTEAAEAMKDLLHAENEGEKKKSEGEGDK